VAYARGTSFLSPKKV